ncbi:transposase [Deinococcus sp. QL22]|uniref:transposase n=1 Tax=Deinococcus sp. QL22 TaxID=2939437 RepID=UPI00352FF9C7
MRKTRAAARRDPEPSAGIIDAQPVRCRPQAGRRGVEAGQKTHGRKRHVRVDTMGLLLVVWITTGDIQDRDGAQTLLQHAQRRFPRLSWFWADGGDAGQWVDGVKQTLCWTLQIIKRTDNAKGFVVLPRRWVVERSLAWLTRSRRLSRDSEGRGQTSATWCYIASIRLMLRRLNPISDPL